MNSTPQKKEQAEQTERAEQLDTLLAAVRAVGMRKTRAIVEVLNALLDAKAPLNLGDLLRPDGPLNGQYEMPTLSRLLNRLETHGFVQKLGFRDRAAYFTLRLPGRHHDYLICTGCGSIETLEIACPVHELETKIARDHKYSAIYHELEFYGLCPSCS